MGTRESVNPTKEVIIMTNYREILRLSSLGLNNTQIAQSCACSRTTVIQTLRLAREKGITFPLPDEMSDKRLAEILFPSAPEPRGYKMPDYCKKALTFTPRPSLKNIQAILSSGQDKVEETISALPESSAKYGFTRGAEYYGGKK